ncbi:MAG: hypothetical protein ACFE7E_00060 [Candidatus Hodarchaeota archaeon]
MVKTRIKILTISFILTLGLIGLVSAQAIVTQTNGSSPHSEMTFLTVSSDGTVTAGGIFNGTELIPGIGSGSPEVQNLMAAALVYWDGDIPPIPPEFLSELIGGDDNGGGTDGFGSFGDISELLNLIPNQMFVTAYPSDLSLSSIQTYSQNLADDFSSAFGLTLTKASEINLTIPEMFGVYVTEYTYISPNVPSGILATLGDLGGLAEAFASVTNAHSIAYGAGIIGNALESLMNISGSGFEDIFGQSFIFAAARWDFYLASAGSHNLSVSQLTGHLGNITWGIDVNTAMLNVMFPTGTNITDYYPTSMTLGYDPPNLSGGFSAGESYSDIWIQFNYTFPLNLSVSRTFAIDGTPVTDDSIPLGTPIEVTLEVENLEVNETATDVILDDSAFFNKYPMVSYLSGDLESSYVYNIGTLAPGQNVTIVYTIQFNEEGFYDYPRAEVSFVWNSTLYAAYSEHFVFEVASLDLFGLLARVVADYPLYAGIGIAIVLGGILYQAYRIIKK